MMILTAIALLLSSLMALALAFCASRFQRWWPRPAVFPLRATALLATIVALRAWLQILEPAPALLAWASTIVLPVAILLWSRPSLPLHDVSVSVRRS